MKALIILSTLALFGSLSVFAETERECAIVTVLGTSGYTVDGNRPYSINKKIKSKYNIPADYSLRGVETCNHNFLISWISFNNNYTASAYINGTKVWVRDFKSSPFRECWSQGCIGSKKLNLNAGFIE